MHVDWKIWIFSDEFSCGSSVFTFCSIDYYGLVKPFLTTVRCIFNTSFSTSSPFSHENDEEMQSFESEADHVMRNQLIVLLFVCHTRAICRPLFRFSPRLWKICIFVHRLITFAYQVWSLAFGVVSFPPKKLQFVYDGSAPSWLAGGRSRGAWCARKEWAWSWMKWFLNFMAFDSKFNWFKLKFLKFDFNWIKLIDLIGICFAVHGHWIPQLRGSGPDDAHISRGERPALFTGETLI